jgi:hypothetical protein
MRLNIAFPIVAFVLLARAALAADVEHETGVPLSPREAAGGWTVESHGRSICMIRLSDARRAGGAYGARVEGDCGDVLPDGVAGWAPTTGGMALTDQAGQVLLPFDRWSNSLFVSAISTGDNVQLMRGAPTAR